MKYISYLSLKKDVNKKSNFFSCQTKSISPLNTKGGYKSENVEGFVNLPKNIPKNYLKFVHPVHDIDKTSILSLFDFTSLTYL